MEHELSQARAPSLFNFLFVFLFYFLIFIYFELDNIIYFNLIFVSSFYIFKQTFQYLNDA